MCFMFSLSWLTFEGTKAMGWKELAHKEIASQCAGSWAKKNLYKNGRVRKSPRSYPVPPLAQMLVVCLAQDAERQAIAVLERCGVSCNV